MRPKHPVGLPDHVRSILHDPGRLAVLGAIAQDSAADPDFDRLATMASHVLAAPAALVSLVEAERQWFKARVGVAADETDVEVSFCAHVIAGEDALVIEDASADARFASNPFVTGEPNVRFYAGVPIVVAGMRLGTVSVIDFEPRTRPTQSQLDQLKGLADLAASLFALKDSTRSGVVARAALEREEKRRAVAVEAASLASWVWDVPADQVECDVLLAELFGLPRSDRMNARTVFRAIDRRDAVATQRHFRASITEGDDYFGEYRVRSTEPARWLAARGRVVERDEEGKPLLVVGVNYDVTERKLAEERQRLLLRELNHRVKNTLATVQALASQTVRHARRPDEFLEAFGNRLQALSLAHGLLSDNEWRGIRMDELVRREFNAFDAGVVQRVAISGKPVVLTPDQALGLGLILHELASNAVKHGALSAPSGRVSLTWHVTGSAGDRRVSVLWLEQGGPSVTAPRHHGFGTILIRRSMAKVLGSTVEHEFTPTGVVAEISFPASPVDEAE